MSSFEKSSKALQALTVNSVSAEVLNYLEAFQADAEALETEVRNAVTLLDEETATLMLAVVDLQDALTDPAVAVEIVRARVEAKTAEAAAAKARNAELAPPGQAQADPENVGHGG